MSGCTLACDLDCVHLRLFWALTCNACPEPTMDELSSVLREVLRALGMDGEPRVHAPWGAAEGGAHAHGPEDEAAVG